jgi:metallophosphoesterase (TIGR00282 family)
VWEKREFLTILNSDEPVLRPANYPGSVSGVGFARIEKNEISWLVINLQGREHMYAIDCPFQSFDRIVNIEAGRATDNHSLVTDNGAPLPEGFPVILIDFHAESSREKEALAYYVDGQVSLIAGTHTHVQTGDERILPKGSAYITDLGMTGIIDSVIGMDPSICLDRVRKQVLYRMETAAISDTAQMQMQGVTAEIDADTGTAISIRRI